MSSGLVDLLRLPPRQPILGLMSGVVADNKDPLDIGRVRVRLPSLSDDSVTPWARIAVPMAGTQRGLYTLPEVGDEVLVGFERGDPELPYVLGALWNTNAKPPESNASGTNDHRTLTSRSGHIIRLDDTDRKEQIEIVDKSTNNTVVISSADNSITISATGDITISSKSGKVKLQGADVEITAQRSLKADAGTTAELSCDAQTTIKGQAVAIN